MERTWLESELAAGRSIEAIARTVGRDPSTVAYWVHKHGLVSQHAAKHAARGGLEREVLVPLVERGLSVQQIAAELGVGGTTVRHWLRQHGLAPCGRLARSLPRDGRAASCGPAGVMAPRPSCAVATASATGVGVPCRGGVGAATTRQANSDRGGGGRVSALWLRPLCRCAAVSTTLIHREGLCDRRSWPGAVARSSARGGWPNASLSAPTATPNSRVAGASIDPPVRVVEHQTQRPTQYTGRG